MYVYKEIERPLYAPDDTKMIELELQHLKLLRDGNTDDNTGGAKHIVRLMAAVVSDNPYRTSTDRADTEQQTVVRGILLEYHPNGSLKEALLTAEMRQTQPAGGYKCTDSTGEEAVAPLGSLRCARTAIPSCAGVGESGSQAGECGHLRRGEGGHH
jgi:hypothetical protein